MKRFLTFTPSLFFLLFSLNAFSQTIDAGKQFMYYEKYVSAIETFNKIVQQNPAQAEAVYLLGQSMLLQDDNVDIDAVSNLYETGLKTSPDNPLLLTGKGQVLLLQNKLTEARALFNQSIQISQGKSIAILNAVGLANIRAKAGDAVYAIEQLQKATTLKGFKDPDVWCNLGDAHRKNFDGSNAQQSYKAALDINPKYARAYMRTAEIFLTYGSDYESIFMKWFDDALAKDPNYAPVYNRLYTYYYNLDVNKSGQYLDKYLAAMGKDVPNACYYTASMLYAQGNFNNAISKADECITNGGAKPFANLYGLKAYAYSRLNDSLAAKTAFEAYFTKQVSSKLMPGDYGAYAEILLKFPGNEEKAASIIEQGIQLDSSEAGKVLLVSKMISQFTKQNKTKELAFWYGRLVQVKKNPRKTDVYNMAYTYSKSGDLVAAVEGWKMYTEKFPDDIYGYDMTAKTLWNIDSTMEKGLANPSFEKVISMGEAAWATDSVKVKAQLIRAYKYFIAYSFNIEKDKNKALVFCDKVLAKDPLDEEALSNKKAIQPAVTPPKKKAN
ncbi:MAG: tetratricopeptide repeat protein [Ferruginibacter sp.]